MNDQDTRTPNDEQSAVITIDEIKSPRVLVCAGAGSGKTATLIWRLIAEHEARPECNAHRTYVMTFTNVAAIQLQKRLNQHGISVSHVGTLHSFAIAQIREFGDKLGYTGWPKVIDERTADWMIKKQAEKLQVKKPVLSAIRAALGSPPLNQAAIVARAYRAQCRETNVICYDLMLAELQLLIEMGFVTGPDTLIVDEFQDSGDRDAAIYDLLKAKFDLRVGDFDQSMYSFRGGNIRHIQAFAKRAAVLHLTTNYRSHAAIVAKANRLIEGAPGNPYRQPMAASIATGNVSFSVQDFANPVEECDAIFAAIKQSGLPRSQIAILCRYNERAKTIREALRNRGIEVAERQRVNLPKRVIAALRAIQLKAVKNEDQVCADWLQTMDTRQTFSTAPAPTVRGVLRQIGVVPTMPVGEQLKRMKLTDEDVWLVNANWQGCPETTADALELLEEIDTASAGVHVGTVHSFKGAEAEMVWCAGWEQQSIPATKKGDAHDEERRIAYVAMTRPKRHLFISWCHLCPDSGGFKMLNGTASQFIPTE